MKVHKMMKHQQLMEMARQQLGGQFLLEVIIVFGIDECLAFFRMMRSKSRLGL